MILSTPKGFSKNKIIPFQEVLGHLGDGPAHIGDCSQLVILIRKQFKIESQNGEYDNITLEEDDVLAEKRYFLFLNVEDKWGF